MAFGFFLPEWLNHDFDALFTWGGIVAEAALFALLMRRRAWHRLPVFVCWMLWDILTDLAGFFIRLHFGDTVYFRYYMYEMPMDSLVQFCVLVELAWSVLRPLQASLPRWTLLALSVLILLAGAAVWPLAGTTVMHDLAQQWHLLLSLQNTFSILRILFFLVLAGGSQFLSLGWRDRELQIATGLGFFSLISLAVAVLHTQMPKVANYHPVDLLMNASYVCTLIFWLVCFLQKEAPRHEFTPQMENFLLQLSGVSQATRIALQNQNRPPDHRS